MVGFLLIISMFLGVLPGTHHIANALDIACSERPVLIKPKVFKKLSRAHKYITDSNYDDALAILEPLDAKNYDASTSAQVWQAIGYVYSSQNKMKKAATYFQKIISNPDTPCRILQSSLYVLGQLALQNGEYDKCIEYVLEWQKTQEKPNAASNMLIAGAYIQKEDFKGAEPYAEKAVSISTKPNKTWLKTLLAVYFENKKYQKASDTLGDLISYWPEDGDLWKKQISLYLTMREDDKAYSLSRLAVKRGILDSETTLKQTVQLAYVNGSPYYGARLLERLMQEGSMPKNLKNQELLIQGWTLAKEMDKAIAAMDAAAPFDKDGDIASQRGFLLMESEKWEEAIKSFEQSLKKGGGDRKEYVRLGLGISQVKAGKLEQARKTFMQAKKNEKTASSATQWINHINETTKSQQ